jgi:hypothetical protein
MSGTPGYVSPSELEWLWTQFDERAAAGQTGMSADVGERRRGGERRQP